MKSCWADTLTGRIAKKTELIHKSRRKRSPVEKERGNPNEPIRAKMALSTNSSLTIYLSREYRVLRARKLYASYSQALSIVELWPLN